MKITSNEILRKNLQIVIYNIGQLDDNWYLFCGSQQISDCLRQRGDTDDAFEQAGGSEARGRVTLYDGLEFQRLADADELDLPGVLLASWQLWRVGEDVAERSLVEHLSKKNDPGEIKVEKN